MEEGCCEVPLAELLAEMQLIKQEGSGSVSLLIIKPTDLEPFPFPQPLTCFCTPHLPDPTWSCRVLHSLGVSFTPGRARPGCEIRWGRAWFSSAN